MRTIKFLVVFAALVGLGFGLYWYTTRAEREAGKRAAEAVDRELEGSGRLLLEAPADTAVVDTVGGVID